MLVIGFQPVGDYWNVRTRAFGRATKVDTAGFDTILYALRQHGDKPQLIDHNRSRYTIECNDSARTVIDDILRIAAV